MYAHTLPHSESLPARRTNHTPKLTRKLALLDLLPLHGLLQLPRHLGARGAALLQAQLIHRGPQLFDLRGCEGGVGEAGVSVLEALSVHWCSSKRAQSNSLALRGMWRQAGSMQQQMRTLRICASRSTSIFSTALCWPCKWEAGSGSAARLGRAGGKGGWKAAWMWSR